MGEGIDARYCIGRIRVLHDSDNKVKAIFEPQATIGGATDGSTGNDEIVQQMSIMNGLQHREDEVLEQEGDLL